MSWGRQRSGLDIISYTHHGTQILRRRQLQDEPDQQEWSDISCKRPKPSRSRPKYRSVILSVTRSAFTVPSRGRHCALSNISDIYQGTCAQGYRGISTELPFQGIRCIYRRDQACASSRHPIAVQLTQICSPKQLVDAEIPYVILGKLIVYGNWVVGTITTGQGTLRGVRTLRKLRRSLLRRSARLLTITWKSFSALERPWRSARLVRQPQSFRSNLWPSSRSLKNLIGGQWKSLLLYPLYRAEMHI